MEKGFKNTINYIQKDNIFIGKCASTGILTQAKSLEELEKKLKALGKIWLNFVLEAYNKEFELIEVNEL